MVSARTGIGAAAAISRIAETAPVTTLTPLIPTVPPIPARLPPDHKGWASTAEQPIGLETNGKPPLQLPGHTSDSKRDFNRPGRQLEDEASATLERRQYRRGGVEERAVAQIVPARSGDNHRTRRSARRKDANKPSIGSELLAKPVWHDLGSSVQDDHIIRRARKVAVGGSGRLQRHI